MRAKDLTTAATTNETRAGLCTNQLALLSAYFRSRHGRALIELGLIEQNGL